VTGLGFGRLLPKARPRADKPMAEYVNSEIPFHTRQSNVHGDNPANKKIPKGSDVEASNNLSNSSGSYAYAEGFRNIVFSLNPSAFLINLVIPS
jgi:hypothetical protein